MAEVHQGTKITREEAKTLDRSKMAVAITQVPEVEGQEPYYDIVACPWCGNLGRVILDTDFYVWLTCGRCGEHFRK